MSSNSCKYMLAVTLSASAWLWASAASAAPCGLSSIDPACPSSPANINNPNNPANPNSPLNPSNQPYSGENIANPYSTYNLQHPESPNSALNILNPNNPASINNPNNPSNPNSLNNPSNPNSPLYPRSRANDDESEADKEQRQHRIHYKDGFSGLFSYLGGGHPVVVYWRGGVERECHLRTDCPRSVYLEGNAPVPDQVAAEPEDAPVPAPHRKTRKKRATPG